MFEFDYIIAGGGAAGLSLAHHLVNSSLQKKTILIIDKDLKVKNDRTWCFWTTTPTLFDEIIYRSWDQIRFIGDQFDHVYQINPYAYKMIRGIDFYQYSQRLLTKLPNVEWVTGTVDQIIDHSDGVQVIVDGVSYWGKWVFDSRFQPTDLVRVPDRYHYLYQHFKGWEIETSIPFFDPSTVTLFDFRTTQKNEMRFIYILPFSKDRGLVEYTLFSSDLLRDDEYDLGLSDYLEKMVGGNHYKINATETGIIPMTDYPFHRRATQHVMTIGTKGGRVKPSTGYAFLRIQKDSLNITNSLLKYGDPFHISDDDPIHRLNDSIMLQLMYRRGATMHTVFTQLFKNNPIDRLFRFLDESVSFPDMVRVWSSVQPGPFIKASFKTKVLRNI